MVDRIKLIMEKSGLSRSDFAELLGIQPSSLSHILSGRNKPSLDFVYKLLAAFDSVSSDWLLFGNGNISSQSGSTPMSVDSQITKDEDSPAYGKIENQKAKKTPEISTGLADGIPERIVFFFPDGSFKQYK